MLNINISEYAARHYDVPMLLDPITNIRASPRYPPRVSYQVAMNAEKEDPFAYSVMMISLRLSDVSWIVSCRRAHMDNHYTKAISYQPGQWYNFSCQLSCPPGATRAENGDRSLGGTTRVS